MLRNLFLLILLIFLTSPSIAATWWETGSYTGAAPIDSVTAYCDASSSCLEVCRLISSTSTLYSYKTASYPGQCDTSNDSVTVFSALRSGPCPSSLSYEWPDGTCHAETLPDCTSGSDSQYHFLTLEQIDSNNYWLVPINGCLYEMALVEECAEYSDGVKGCNVTYTQTDNNTSTYSGESELPTDATDNLPRQNGNPDTRETTSQTTIGDTTVTNNPDGSTTEQQQTVTNSTEAQGTVMWESNGKVYIQDSTGKVTTTTQDELIQRAADNTYTETTTTTTTTTTPTKTTQTIDKTAKTSTTTTTSGSTSTSTSSKTSTYNAQGTKTGESSSSSGGNGDGTGDGTEEGDCDPITEDCGSGAYTSGDKSGLYTKTDKTYSSVLTDFTNRISSSGIGSAMTGFFDVSISGTCPVWSADIGPLGVITIDQQCSEVMNSIWPIISAILICVAGFFAWRVAIE